MFRVAVKVFGEPDFYPDHLDVPAPPPWGTAVDIAGRAFTVHRLRLTVNVRQHDGGGEVWTSHYTAELLPQSSAQEDRR